MGIILRLLGIAIAGAAAGVLVRTRKVNRDYATLDLEPSASPEEVQRAYKDLVQVWHPDRFAHDPRLQRKAQVKLQAINDAYARLGKR
jgi:DnaJ-class molecular chaperone